MTMRIGRIGLMGLVVTTVTACGTTVPAAPSTSGDSAAFHVQQAYGAPPGMGWGGAPGRGRYGASAMSAPGAWRGQGGMNPWNGMNPWAAAGPNGGMSPWGGMSPYGYGSPWAMPGAWGGQNPYGNWGAAGWGQPGMPDINGLLSAISSLDPQTLSLLASAVMSALQNPSILSAFGSGMTPGNLQTAR